MLIVDPEGGHWVKFVVTRVPASPEKPHGLDYSLTRHGPLGERLVGFDNAHQVRPRQARRAAGPSASPPDREAIRLRRRGHIAGRLLAGGGRGVEGARRDVSTLGKGEEKPAPGDPKVWFPSTESFAKVLSAGNRELLRVIADKAPAWRNCRKSPAAPYPTCRAP